MRRGRRLTVGEDEYEESEDGLEELDFERKPDVYDPFVDDEPDFDELGD